MSILGFLTDKMDSVLIMAQADSKLISALGEVEMRFRILLRTIDRVMRIVEKASHKDRGILIEYDYFEMSTHTYKGYAIFLAPDLYVNNIIQKRFEMDLDGKSDEVLRFVVEQRPDLISEESKEYRDLRKIKNQDDINSLSDFLLEMADGLDKITDIYIDYMPRLEYDIMIKTMDEK